MRWRSIAPFAATLSLASPFCVVAAQTVPPVDSSRFVSDPVPCAGQKISDVIVITQPPYPAQLPGDLDIVRNLTRKLHANTRDNVVRRYLLMEIGDTCDEVRRAESERIMRQQPFLVDARIVTYPDGHGGVRLEIETRDEFSLIFEPNISAKSPVVRGMRLGESNLAGAGIHAAVQWRDGGAYRDLMGIRIQDYQFLGGRNVMRLFGTRMPQGHDFGLEVLRPYLTDLQKLAWRGKVGGTRTYEPLLSPDVEGNAIRVDREFQDVGAVGRVGNVGRLRLFGLSLSRELVSIGDQPVALTDKGFGRPVMTRVPAHYRNLDVTRINALMGFRRLRFVRVEGFDALSGVQDMRVGVQSGFLIGRSMPLLGARDRDMFMLGDFYAGYGNERQFIGMQTLSEARRDRNTGTWDGVLTSGRVAWYLRPAAKQLTLTEVLWSTGTLIKVPYQLTFDDPDGGMRGYRNSRTPGAHRLVVRVEERIRIPSRYTVADFGAAMFVEGGKLWADKVPFATSSPFRGSVGLSILAAVPPRSRRLWRVDFAMPVGGDPDAKFEVRFTNADRTRTFWQDPIDMRRARERAVPTGIFTWP